MVGFQRELDKIAEAETKSAVIESGKSLGVGAAAGVISTFLTNPLDQIANMKATFPEKFKGKSILDSAKLIKKEHGLKGFYAGFGAKALKTAPQSALWLGTASLLGKLTKTKTESIS